MSRPLTPAERHERALARMDLGSMHGQASQAAPVRRQGPKGRVVPAPAADEEHDHDLSAQTPTAIEEGGGAPGDIGEGADAGHAHPLALSDETPTSIMEGLGFPGVGSLMVRHDHGHAFDPDALGLARTGHGDADHDVPYTPVADFTAHSGETETAHGADVNATPNAIARRNPAGQVVAAPSTAAGHAIVHEQATVAATASAVARRNAAGQVETADATAAAHAVTKAQLDAVSAGGVPVLATDEHALTDSPTVYPDGLSLMPVTSGAGWPQTGTVLTVNEGEVNGTQQVLVWTSRTYVRGWSTFLGNWTTWNERASTSYVDTEVGDHAGAGNPHSSSASTSYVDTGVGTRVAKAGDTMTGPLSLPNGERVLRFSGAPGTGLQHEGGGAMGLIVGTVGAVLTSTGFRPRTATAMNLGTASRPWHEGHFDDVIETTHSDAGGPSITAAGSIEAGSNLVANMSSGGVLGSFVAAQALNSLNDGTQVTIDPKSSSVRVFRVGVGYRPIEASAFTVNSDRATKRDIRDDDSDALADVLGTRVRRYRGNARKVRPVDASPYGEESEPDVLDEYEDDAEHVGLVADEAPEDVRTAMGDGEGIDLYAMCSKLWKAVQQQQAHIEELRARLA